MEQAHIKDALSRLLVEMVKREWPQQWPSLMDELHALCTMGVSALVRATPWPGDVRGPPYSYTSRLRALATVCVVRQACCEVFQLGVR